MEEYICTVCKIKFKRYRSVQKNRPNPCCSRACANKFKAPAQEKRIQKNCVICNAIFETLPCYEKRHQTCQSPECKKEIKTGERNINWRGGVSSEHKRDMSSKEYKLWRNTVFKRDGYTCQLCGKRGGTLNADHIKPWAYFPDLRHSIENGRTLCLECHKGTYKDVFRYREPYSP